MNISASWLFLYYSWLAGKIVWQKFLWLLYFTIEFQLETFKDVFEKQKM